MKFSTHLVAPGPGFWPQAARLIIKVAANASETAPSGRLSDLSGVRVMVPTFVHLSLLRNAL
ncbi:MAG: hypothetical protein WBJ21_10685, partial [Burkholderiaceae bacterium]